MSGQFDAVFSLHNETMLKNSPSIRAMPDGSPSGRPKRLAYQESERYLSVSVAISIPVQRAARVAFLASLAERVPLDYREGYYKDSLPHAKIILNEAINDDVNFRIFESLMCGGLLLTPLTGNGLLDLFVEGEHLVTYENT